MHFYENFINACKMNEISPSALLTKIGKSNSLNTQWKNGSLPSVDLILSISNALKVSPNYLLTGEESEDVLSEDEKYLLELFRKAPYKEQMKFIGRLEETIETINSVNIKPMMKIKCSEYRVSAGFGEMLNEYDSWNTIEIPDTPNAHRADFALIVSGNSMTPMYDDGDVVLVKIADAVEVGQIAVFIIEGEGFIKKFSGDRLCSVNPEYDDIIFSKYDPDFIKCAGLVLGKA